MSRNPKEREWKESEVTDFIFYALEDDMSDDGSPARLAQSLSRLLARILAVSQRED